MKNLNLFLLMTLLCACSGHKKMDRDKGAVSDSVSETVAETHKVIDRGRKDIPIYSDCAGVKNKLSQIAKHIEFCALADEPALDNFLVNDIALTNEDIFILWRLDAIYRFDRSGALKNNIGTKGQGPKEYVQPEAPLMLDRNRNLIYVLDVVQRKVCSYQYDGTFNESIPVKHGISNLELTDSSTFIARTNCSERFHTTTSVLKFMNQKGKVTRTYKSHIYPIEKDNVKGTHFGAEVNPLWRYGDIYYSWEYGNDTIFRIEGTDMIPDRTLSGNKYKPSMYNLFHSGNGDKRLILPGLFRPNAAIFESDCFVLFRCFNEKVRYFLVYDKTDGNVYMSLHDDAPRREKTDEVLSAYFTDDLVSGMSFNPEYQSNGKLIGWLTAPDIVEKRDEIVQYIETHSSEESQRFKEIVMKITEEDNPVLMIVTLK